MQFQTATSSLRAKRSKRRNGLLRCARNDAEKHASAFPRRKFVRVVASSVGPRTTEGAGKAGCTTAPAASRGNERNHTSSSHYGSAEHSGLPCAIGLRLI